MADLTRHRDHLEIAAASSDPVIRQMAFSLKDMRAKIESIDTVLKLYAETSIQMQTKQPAGNGATRPLLKTVTSDAPTKDGFGDTVKAILVGGPLSLNDFYAEFQRRVPGDTRNKEAFRSALGKRKAYIGRVSEDDNRFCLLGMQNVSAAA